MPQKGPQSGEPPKMRAASVAAYWFGSITEKAKPKPKETKSRMMEKNETSFNMWPMTMVSTPTD